MVQSLTFSLPRSVRVLCVCVSMVCVLASCRHAKLVVATPENQRCVVVRDVSVLDVESGDRQSHKDVLVDGGRIQEVAASTPAYRRDCVEIDGRGATLLPGLVDMHAHVATSPAPVGSGGLPDPTANLAAYLYCGVTTVVDLGGLVPNVLELREGIAAGRILGPTLYVSGPVLTTAGGHPVPVLKMMLPALLQWYVIPRYAVEVDDVAGAAVEAERIAGMGVDFLKVIVDRIPNDAPRLDNEELANAVAAARRQGVRSVAHIGTTRDALDAAEAGVALWGHVVYRERIPDEDVPRLAAFHIPMVPTIVGFEALASAGQPGRVATLLEKETVQPEILAAFAEPVRDESVAAFTDETVRFLSTQRQNWRDNVRRLHRAGATILAGSDMQSGVFPGAGLHRELGHLVEAGLTNLEVIQAATVRAAQFLEAGDNPSFGVVAPGKRADLLLVDGDPLADLTNLASIRAVLVRGVPIERVSVNGRR